MAKEAVGNGKIKSKYKFSLVGSINLIAAVLGIISFPLLLLPRISIEIIGPTDPTNSFSVISNITNNGFLSLRDVQVGMGWGKGYVVGKKQDLKFLETYIKENPNAEIPSISKLDLASGMFDPEWVVNKMASDEKFSVPIGHKLKTGPDSELGYADFTISVFYKIWIFPHKFHQEQGYKSRVRSDGLIDWIYQPADPSRIYEAP